MFQEAGAFNQDISWWDTSSISWMFRTFQQANSFNQDISWWNISNVIDMRYMFVDNTTFDQDLSSWSVTWVINCVWFSSGTSASWTAAEKPNFTNCTP